MYKLRTYVASGWFTTNQCVTLKILEGILHRHPEFDLFLPQVESFGLQGSLHLPETRKFIFNTNIRAMLAADLVICSTEDKDMGSVWEGGFVYAHKIPTVYVNFHLGKAPFNLMLTESGIAIARDEKTFEKILQKIVKEGLEDRSVFDEFKKEETAE